MARGRDDEPSLVVPPEQLAIRREPDRRKRWAFWKRQAEGNQALAWRRLREQWDERDQKTATAAAERPRAAVGTKPSAKPTRPLTGRRRGRKGAAAKLWR